VEQQRPPTSSCLSASDRRQTPNQPPTQSPPKHPQSPLCPPTSSCLSASDRIQAPKPPPPPKAPAPTPQSPLCPPTSSCLSASDRTYARLMRRPSARMMDLAPVRPGGGWGPLLTRSWGGWKWGIQGGLKGGGQAWSGGRCWLGPEGVWARLIGGGSTRARRGGVRSPKSRHNPNLRPPFGPSPPDNRPPSPTCSLSPPPKPLCPPDPLPPKPDLQLVPVEGRHRLGEGEVERNGPRHAQLVDANVGVAFGGVGVGWG
jgi:hypothetical protein